MTALDKAFIKAYSQDELHARVPRPHFATRQDHTSRTNDADAVVAQAKHLNSASAESAIPSEPLINKPHFDLAASSQAAQYDPVHPLAVFSEPVEEPQAFSVTKIPLVPPKCVQPTFEVDQVVWPDVCQQLSISIGDGLDSVLNAYLRAEGGRTRSIGLMSTGRGCGCTTVTLTLAHHMCRQRSALASASLLVIDADLRNPSLARSLGLAPQTCWRSVCSNSGALGDAMIESIADRMVVMPLEDSHETTVTAIDNEQLSSDIQNVSQQHPALLVDFGSFESAQSSNMLPALANQLDAILLVHDQRRGDSELLERTVRAASEAGIEIAGVIENGSADAVRPTLVA